MILKSYETTFKGFLTYWLLIFLVCSFSLPGQTVDSLYVIIDMRTPIKEGWFLPDSETAGLRGDKKPLSWSKTFRAFDPEGDSIYSVFVPFAVTGDSLELQFKIKVDGKDNPNDGWQAGQNHHFTVRSDNSNKLTLAWEDVILTPPSRITGNVVTVKNFKSKKLSPRDLFIYLPPDYFENEFKRYPVLYMQDGQNLFEESVLISEWGLDEAAESLIKSGEIKPLIIVGIGNTENRIEEYTPWQMIWHKELKRITPSTDKGKYNRYSGSFTFESNDTIHFSSTLDSLFAMIPGSDFWQLLTEKSDSVFFLSQAGITFLFHKNDDYPVTKITADKPTRGGDGDLYGDFIVNELKPFIDKKFRTRREMDLTAIGGSSLGGLISLYLGLQQPETFGNLLIVSPSVWWNDKQILNTIKNLPEQTEQRIWLYVGTEESGESLSNVQLLKEALLEKGWFENNIGYMESPGAVHSESAWSKQAKDMLRFLFPTK